VSSFFDRLFGKKKQSSQDVATAPLSEEQLESVYHGGGRSKTSPVDGACAQSVGKQRDHNEDSVFTFKLPWQMDRKTFHSGFLLLQMVWAVTSTAKLPAEWHAGQWLNISCASFIRRCSA
jgi:hypothetical protein